MKNDEIERAAFERWATTEATPRLTVVRRSDDAWRGSQAGAYSDVDTFFAWQAWLARSALSAHAPARAMPAQERPETGDRGDRMPTCPRCGGQLVEVANRSAYLNDDQAAAQRAGDFYCEKCPPNGRSEANRYCYWWKREIAAFAPAPSREAPEAGEAVKDACAKEADRILASWGYADDPDSVRAQVGARIRALPLPAPEATRAGENPWCYVVADADMRGWDGEYYKVKGAADGEAMVANKQVEVPGQWRVVPLYAHPTPPRAEGVEAKRRAVVDAAKRYHQEFIPITEDVNARNDLHAAVDALLAAEAAEREKGGGRGK